MSNQIFLSVIIPCYNEKENINRGVLDQVFNYLDQQSYSWEVVVSDDGSTDGSLSLVKHSLSQRKGSLLVENKHGGKPAAVWGGIQKASGKYVLFDDMDQSTPITELRKFEPYFNQFDIIIGSRGVVRKNYSFIRRLGSMVFLRIRKLLLLNQIEDTQCGFKLMRRNAAMKLFPLLEFFNDKKPVKGWKVTSYDVELLFLADKHHYSIKEIPVLWENTDVSTGKERSYLKESREMLRQIIRVKINDLRGYYKVDK